MIFQEVWYREASLTKQKTRLEKALSENKYDFNAWGELEKLLRRTSPTEDQWRGEWTRKWLRLFPDPRPRHEAKLKYAFPPDSPVHTWYPFIDKLRDIAHLTDLDKLPYNSRES